MPVSMFYVTVLLCLGSFSQGFRAAVNPAGDLARGHFSSPKRTTEGQMEAVSSWTREGSRYGHLGSVTESPDRLRCPFEVWFRRLLTL